MTWLSIGLAGLSEASSIEMPSGICETMTVQNIEALLQIACKEYHDARPRIKGPRCISQLSIRGFGVRV